MLTGLVLNVTLLGVMITQLYIYYTTYKRDKIWMKVFVRPIVPLEYRSQLTPLSGCLSFRGRHRQ